MTNDPQKQTNLRPAGYLALLDRYDLDVIPHWRKSFVTNSGILRFHPVSSPLATPFFDRRSRSLFDNISGWTIESDSSRGAIVDW